MTRTALERIFIALNGADVRYLVVGGLAVNAHGYLRFTKDLDLVVELSVDNASRAMAVLTELGYRPAVPVRADDFADADQRRAWIAEKGLQVFQLWSDQARDTPIDVFVTEPFDFQAEFDKALRKDLDEGVTVRFVRIQALLQMKRDAGRPQDLADIAELELLHGKHEAD